MHGAFKQGCGDGLDRAALNGGLALEFGLHFGSDIERDGHRRLVRQKHEFFLHATPWPRVESSIERDGARDQTVRNATSPRGSITLSRLPRLFACHKSAAGGSRFQSPSSPLPPSAFRGL